MINCHVKRKARPGFNPGLSTRVEPTLRRSMWKQYKLSFMWTQQQGIVISRVLVQMCPGQSFVWLRHWSAPEFWWGLAHGTTVFNTVTMWAVAVCNVYLRLEIMKWLIGPHIHCQFKMATGNRKWAEGRRIIVGVKTFVQIWNNLALWGKLVEWETWKLRVAMSTQLSLCTRPYSCGLLRHYIAAVTAFSVTAVHVSHGTLVL